MCVLAVVVEKKTVRLHSQTEHTQKTIYRINRKNVIRHFSSWASSIMRKWVVSVLTNVPIYNKIDQFMGHTSINIKWNKEKTKICGGRTFAKRTYVFIDKIGLYTWIIWVNLYLAREAWWMEKHSGRCIRYVICVHTQSVAESLTGQELQLYTILRCFFFCYSFHSHQPWNASYFKEHCFFFYSQFHCRPDHANTPFRDWRAR